MNKPKPLNALVLSRLTDATRHLSVMAAELQAAVAWLALLVPDAPEQVLADRIDGVRKGIQSAESAFWGIQGEWAWGVDCLEDKDLYQPPVEPLLLLPKLPSVPPKKPAVARRAKRARGIDDE